MKKGNLVPNIVGSIYFRSRQALWTLVGDDLDSHAAMDPELFPDIVLELRSRGTLLSSIVEDAMPNSLTKRIRV